ncbi:MAG: DUF1501 domain-containing protein [Bdellovibrionota bacterium]
MHEITRRKFLALSATGAGALFLPTRAFSAFSKSAADADPHFFLQIILEAGADPTYLCDSRPFSMTAANLLQNYNTVEGVPYTGLNGGTCILPESSKALRPFLNRFSIVNGVMMNSTFDGHEQNMNFYMTGSPTGGASFLPSLGSAGGFPLDGVQNGDLRANIANHGHVVPMDPATVALLKDKLTENTPVTPGSELYGFIESRLAAIGGGPGRFSAGAGQMLTGFRASSTLRSRLLGIDKPDPALKPEEQFVSLLGSVFRNRVAGSALWVFTDNFDVHSDEEAKKQPKLFKEVSERLASVFAMMAATPFDDKRSLLDVTTVVVNSEFGRTMRQLDKPISQTGTDHNQFNNSFLIGGKGIKGGLVIGSSDCNSPGETPCEVHKTFDPRGLKMMGCAFDFAAQKSVDSPAVYDARRWLTSDSVVNTIYSLFGVARGNFRTVDRDGNQAQVLSSLLS